MTQAGLWLVSGIAAAVALVAAIADRLRNRRRNLDRVGLVPWPLIQLLAMLIAAVTAALALKV